jgi:hypothetical protein
MTINYRQEADVEATDGELAQLRLENDTIWIAKHQGNGKHHHWRECNILETNGLTLVERELACYPGDWFRPCNICLAEWRRERQD